MLPILETLDLRDPDAVVAALLAGSRACAAARCRTGSIERVTIDPAAPPPARTLIATGDLHDHPVHLLRLLTAAGMTDASADPAHLTLHELIHSDRLVNGLDYSFRLLTRVAALKAAFPERLHVLLANHEIAQLTGSPVAKNGVRCNDVFDEAVQAAFHDRAADVLLAVRAFLRALPLAVRFDTPHGSILCAHSLPAAADMDRFDQVVLDRDLTDDDLTPRRGSAHLLTWGRAHEPDHVDRLARLWNVDLFILGHELVEHGATTIADRALVLNSDHDHGVYVPVDLAAPVLPAPALAARAVRLSAP